MITKIKKEKRLNLTQCSIPSEFILLYVHVLSSDIRIISALLQSTAVFTHFYIWVERGILNASALSKYTAEWSCQDMNTYHARTPVLSANILATMRPIKIINSE